MSYSFRPANDGIDLVVSGPWSKKAADAIHSGRADGLVLNYALGFQGRDLAFIQGLPLKRLSILARTMNDLGPIHSLGSTLESLSVQSNGRDQIDLGRLPQLRNLSATWPQVRSSITEAPNLQDCFFLSYDDQDLVPLVGLSKLQTLRMKDKPALTSLDGVAHIPSLRNLGVYGAPLLADLTGIADAGAPNLRRLEVQSCRRITTIEAVSACRELDLFNAADCGEIESLQPLEHCSGLSTLWLYGSTSIKDKNLSPLLRLPLLTEVAIVNRRGYSPTADEVEAEVESRKLRRGRV